MKKTHRKLKIIGMILGLLILIVLSGIIICQFPYGIITVLPAT